MLVPLKVAVAVVLLYHADRMLTPGAKISTPVEATAMVSNKYPENVTHISRSGHCTRASKSTGYGAMVATMHAKWWPSGTSGH